MSKRRLHEDSSPKARRSRANLTDASWKRACFRQRASDSHRKLRSHLKTRSGGKVPFRKERKVMNNVLTSVASDSSLNSETSSEVTETLRHALLTSGGTLSLEYLKHIIFNQGDDVLKLCTEDADLFMTILQSKIDTMAPEDEHRGVFIDTLLQLAIATTVPTFLEIKGITHYWKDNYITAGGFGDIFKALLNDRTVALKRLRETGGIEREKLHRNLCREVLLWRQLHHPNILEFLGICKDVFTLPAIVSLWMENGNVMRFVSRSRYGAFNNPKREEMKYRLLSQVSRALDYLHSHNPAIVHQDVRCANILVNDAGEAVLSDFGLSRLDSSFFNTFTSSLEHGCVRWQAPELLFPDIVMHDEVQPDVGSKEAQEEDTSVFLPSPSPASDVYALGMTALELFSEQKPYSSFIIDASVVLEVYHNRRPRHNPFEVDKQTWEFFSACWSRNPLDRPSAASAVDFFTTVVPDEGFRVPSGLSGPMESRSVVPNPNEEVLRMPIPRKLVAALFGKNSCIYAPIRWPHGDVTTSTYCRIAEGQTSDLNEVEIQLTGGPDGVRGLKLELEKIIELYQKFPSRF